MFCPSCGAQLPDGSAVCGYCGAKLDAQPQAQSTPKSAKAPVNMDVAKRLSLISLLTVVLLFISILVPLKGSFFKVPVVKTMLSAEGISSKKIDEIFDEGKEELDDMEDSFKDAKDDMDRAERKATKKIMKVTKKLVRTPSLMNIRKFIKVCDKSIKKVDDFNLAGISGLSRSLDDVKEMTGILIWIAIGLFILPAIFTILAGLKKSMGLTITALVFMVISQALVCGFLWVILSMALYIYQAVLCSQLRQGAGQTANA